MKTIEERARFAAWQIFEEIGLSQHSIDRVAEIIAEKIHEQKAIDDAELLKLKSEWEKEENIIVPRWFLEVVEDTLQIQNNINQPDKKETGESCQDRNIRHSLNGLRKLLNGEELSGMERFEKLKYCNNEANYQQGYHDAIDKACEWLEENARDYACATIRCPYGEEEEIICDVHREIVEDFRKAMEE